MKCIPENIKPKKFITPDKAPLNVKMLSIRWKDKFPTNSGVMGLDSSDTFLANRQIIPKEKSIEPTVLAINKPSPSRFTPIIGNITEGIISIPIPNGINIIALIVKKVESFISICVCI